MAAGLGRRFWRFWGASFTSNLSDGIALIALPWIATTVTDEAFWVGAVAAAGRLPWLIAAIPAGAVIDRHPRLPTMAAAAVVRAVLWGGLGALALTGGLRLDVLLAAAFALGLAEVCYDTAAVTAIPDLVPRARLEAANGQFRTAEITAQEFLGRPVGGFALTAGIAPALFGSAGICALVAVVLARLHKGERREPPDPGERQSGWRRAGAGVAAIWASPLLRRLVGVTMAFNVAYATILATQVLFAQQTLGLDAAQFGLLMLAAAAGGVVGGQVSGVLAARLPAGWLPMASLSATGCCFLVMAAAPVVPVVAAMLFVSSACVLAYTVSASSLRQRVVPAHLLGRVNAAAGTASWGLATVGMGAGGALVSLAQRRLAESDALRLPYALTAAVILVLVCVAGRPITRLSASAAD
ncbi:MFS-type transporter involved in bile tolerance (Atg22 family) [Murinocardiopsis flavida]|uniref:MFS-type transporter involved in bile tolerance (Atg22 family) n=1 Tax=Murinocardiopsis flavida TaxID=645275 RepID=A0A2P8DUM4_9ACTN|nr:MFS transporter [Murinocardiopsis flavida]PSL00882.1 MFS-type transporter involved in bile tolerance (Atg22 family) [Murinocardiopsis flavida]